MASYSKVFNRSGRQAVQDIVNAITLVGQQLDEQRKKQEEKELFNTLLEAYNQSKGRLQNIEDFNAGDVTFQEGDADTVFRTEARPQLETAPPDITSGEGITDIILPDVLLNKKERYKAGQEELSNFRNALLPIIMNPEASETVLKRGNILGDILTSDTEKLKPSGTKRTQEDPFKRTVVTDEFGDVIEIIEAEDKPKDKKSRLLGENIRGGRRGLDYGYIDDEGNKVVTDFDPLDNLNVDKLIAQTREGIQKIKDLKKNKKMLGRDIGLKGELENKVVTLKGEQLNRQRDKIKQQYVQPIIEAVKKRELQEAIDTIREQAEKKGMKNLDNINDVINKFIRANPDYAEDKDVLEAYFELFLL